MSISDTLWDQVEQEAASSGQSLSQIVVEAISIYFRSRAVRASSWDTDESDDWYNEDKFYTFSQDKHGHSAKVDVTIPKMVAGEVAGIIDSGSIPELRTPQDFYRNAIRHQAYRTGKLLREGGLVDAAHQMTVLDRVATQQAIATEYLELEARIVDLLDEELMHSHYDFVESELKEYWKMASSINERFRSQYMELLRHYGTLLEETRQSQIPRRGTHTLPNGRKFKNGVELATPDDRERGEQRRSSTH